MNIFSFPVVFMSLCTYSCCRTMILDLTMVISPLRDIWTRTFSVPFWHCVSAFSSSRNVFQCPSSLVINVCVRLSSTPVNPTHKVLLLPTGTQVDHLSLLTNSGNSEFLPAVTAYPNQSHTFPQRSFLQSLEPVTDIAHQFHNGSGYEGS